MLFMATCTYQVVKRLQIGIARAIGVENLHINRTNRVFQGCTGRARIPANIRHSFNNSMRNNRHVNK
jgi:hypothetical protein